VSASRTADRERILAEVNGLPATWHTAGTLSPAALSAMAKHSGDVAHSMETGTGKSTLLLSHLSQDHKVFTIAGDNDSSYATVTASPLFNKETVEFVIGPTQQTLPAYRFANKLQLALIDGPHGYPFPDLEYFYTYPHLEQGALLVVDDIHIPTVFNMFSFLREDAMFKLLEVVETTAFFRRTDEPTFPPDLDGWWTQQYNFKRFPVSEWPLWGGLRPRMRGAVPIGVRRGLKKVVPEKVRKWFMK
jgi:predicted O-methyltransferase YrrM